MFFPPGATSVNHFPTQLEKEFINHSCRINEYEKIFKKLFHIDKIGNKAKGWYCQKIITKQSEYWPNKRLSILSLKNNIPGA